MKRQIFTMWALFLITTTVTAKTVTVEYTQEPNFVPLAGTVEAIDSATVAAQVPGRITSINFDVNDVVERGQLILTIDDTELVAKLAKAEGVLAATEADNERAEAEFKRFQELSGQSYVSQEELARKQNLVKVSRAKVASAQAQIAEIKQQLAYSKIVAPYTGVMTGRFVNVGETVTVAQPLVAGRAVNNNRVVLQVPVSLLDKVGEPLQLSLPDAQNQPLPLQDITVFPNVDPATRTVTVWASLSNDFEGVRPGAFLTVYLADGQRQRMLVPLSAVFEQGDLELVYVIKEQQRLLRQVRVGQQLGEQVEVLSGLQQGEQVLVDASAHVAGSGL